MAKLQITLSQAIDGYFVAAQARRLSPHTLSDYDNTFRRFEAFLGDDLRLARIAPSDIREFLNSLDGLSAKTVRNYHIGLSALWTWALKEQLVEQHIVRAVQAPKPEQRQVVPYTRHDIKGMLAACDRSRAYRRPGKRRCHNSRPTALRDRAIITLLLDTGIRASELCNLRLCRVDLQNQRVMVMGKGRKERTVPICPKTSQALWRYLATRDNRRNTAFLITSLAEQPLSRFALRRLLMRVGERAGVPGVNVHRFRHTFAISFLRNGGNVFVLQRILGHSSMEMVQRYLAIAQMDLDLVHQDASPVANWL